MKAFGIEAEDTMGIVDRFNEVGNNFAIDSKGIGDALQRSASALVEGGNTIDEAIGLVTAANSVIQNPEQVGTALKTLSLRIRGAKVELEEAGEDTEGMANSVSQLQEKLLALTGGKVDIMLDEDTFKNTTQILREMSTVWEDMTDINQAAALELLGGKRQANILSSIISNFQTVEDVIETSANSAGSAMAENQKYIESIQGHIDVLTNSVQTMWNNALNSDAIKFFIDATNVLVKIIDKVGLLKTAFAALMAIMAFKHNFGILNFLPNLKVQIQSLPGVLGKSTVALKLFNGALTGLTSFGIGLAIAALWKLGDALIVTKKEIQEAAAEAKDAIDTISSELKNTENVVSNSAERFAELAQGVDMLSGKNLSLTTDEYEEFLDLSNQLAEVFPTLSRNYDENGNAIVQLSGDTDTMVSSLQNLLEVERQIANQKIAEELPDLYKGVKSQSDDYNKELKKLENQRDTYENLLSDLTDGGLDENFLDIVFEGGGGPLEGKDLDALNAIVQKYQDVFGELGISLTVQDFVNGDEVAGILNKYTLGIDNWSSYTEEELAELREKVSIGVRDVAATYSDEINNLNYEIQTIVNENKANWGSMLSSIFAWLSTDSSYQVLNDDMQSVIQTMVNNIDFSKLDGVNKWDDMQKWIQDNLITKIQGSSSEVQNAFSELMRIEADDTSLDAYINKIKSKAQEIADMSDGLWTYDEVLQNTGYEDIIQQFETNATNILRVLEDNIPKQYQQYAKGTKAYIDSFEDYEHTIETLQDKIYSLSPDEVTKAFDIIKKYGINTWDELADALKNKTFDVVVDLGTEEEGIQNLLKAIDESVSATGLSSESIANLQKRYQDLESYDPARLFEETANGIHLNAEALRELEAEYEKTNKTALDNKLEGLTEQYNNLTDEIMGCADASERAALYAQRQNVLDQINDTATLAAQYAGLTSEYNKWQNAQSVGADRDMYEGILSGREELEDEMSRGWLDDASRAYIDMLSGKDLSTAPIEDVIAAYEKLDDAINSAGYSVWDFFTTDDDGNSTSEGIFNFFDTVKAAQEKLGKEWVSIDKDGNYTFDFGVNGDQAVADALGISEELVQIILRAAEDAGFTVNLDSAYSELADLQDEAIATNDRLIELGATEYTFNINSTSLVDVEKQIKEAKLAIDNLYNEDGTLRVDVNEEDLENAKTLLATLIYQKQTLDESAILRVNTENANAGIENVIAKLQEFKANYNELEVKTEVGADTTEAQANVDATIASLQSDLSSTEKQLLAQLGVELDDATPEEINAQINSITPELMVECGLDTTLIDEYEASDHTTTGEVVWDNNINKVTAWIKQPHRADGTVYWDDDTSKLKTTYFGTGYITWNAASVNGTAHASGTAYKGGSWGAPRTETALTGELGPEIRVRDGKWELIGSEGAEFTDVKKGDIIFNHKQTEELLANGYVTGRGKAYAEGNAYSSGRGLGRYTITSAYINNSGSSKSSSSKSSSSSSDDAEEVIDFIEIKLEEIEALIAKTTAAIENFLDDTSHTLKKNNYYDNLVEAEKNKAATYLAAAEIYNEKAAQLLQNIPAEYRAMAQNGAIAITDFVGENNVKIADAINEYREWAQKADDTETGYLESIAQIAAYRVEQLEDIADDFENIVNEIDTQSGLIESHIDLIEESGGIVSEKFYKELMQATKEKRADLVKEKSELQKILDDAVESGEVQKGSDEWFKMTEQIYAVDSAIIECDKDLETYQNSINDLHWESLERLMDRFGALDSEISHLYDRLTDNDDIVDDNGLWNDKGIAALGLAAQQMEIAQTEAERYAKEIDYLESSYKKGLYSETEYQEKLAELKESQWESIEAYEEAKDQLVELNRTRINAVKDGLDKELEAYQELIDKKKEALSADKDLYDFEKDVMAQQKEIADLERSLASLSGQTTGSAAAQRRQIEAELAEKRAELNDTYRDRAIENAQNALDKESEAYAEFIDNEKTALDEYLENEEQVVLDSINTVRLNSETVLQELTSLSQQYGVEISDAITAPWNDGVVAISAYKESFSNLASSFSDEIDAIIEQEKKLQQVANQEAQDTIDSIDENKKQVESAEPGKLELPDPNETVEEPVDDSGSSSGGQKSYPYGKASATTGNIGIGSQGKAVKAIQWALNQVGSGNSGTRSLDGIFGSKTKAAVQAFQRYFGITADGIVGKNTRAKFKKLGYAKGTTGVEDDEWAWIDEVGEELVLHAGEDGKLTYLTKGTGVVPSDLTEKLMDLAMDPTAVLDRSRPTISAPHITNNNIELNMDIGEVVHIDTVTNDTLPDLTKAVEKQMDKYMQNINNSLRRFTR